MNSLADFLAGIALGIAIGVAAYETRAAFQRAKDNIDAALAELDDDRHDTPVEHWSDVALSFQDEPPTPYWPTDGLARRRYAR